MEYIIHYDIAAIVLMASVLIHLLSKKRIINYKAKLFQKTLWFIMAAAFLDLITCYIDGPKVPKIFIIGLNFTNLLIFSYVPVLYFLYMAAIARNSGSWSTFRKYALRTPYYTSAFLIVTSPWTKWVFFVNEAGYYEHGPLFVYLYFVCAIYLGLSFYISQHYKSRFRQSQIYPILFYSLATIGCVVVQVLNPKILVLDFAGAVSMLIVYLLMENPRDYEDKALGAYDRNGFIKLVKLEVTKQSNFSVVIIRFTGYQYVRENLGAEFREAFMKQIVEFLMSKVAPHEVCSISDGVFAIVVKRGKSGVVEKGMDIGEIMDFIRDNFNGENGLINFYDMKLMVSATMFCIDYPEDVRSMEDILDAIDYESEFSHELQDGLIVHSADDIIGKMRRKNRIETILKKALAENQFEVYYQPIYSVEKKRFASAEALLRLNNDEIGFIGPDEFIPIAEKTGLIHSIGEFVFRDVCEMISREKLWEKGISYIEVNLSPLQFMQQDMHRKLMDIMDEMNLPYEYINLEITETEAIHSSESVRANIQPLLANGMTFSLDDYGTGYSCISNVINYPFFIIKIDKSMVWSAMQNERALRALRHTVAMIRDLDINIVAEGVETEEQAQVLIDMGCGYLQGYLYAKPMPEASFLEFTNEKFKEMQNA